MIKDVMQRYPWLLVFTSSSLAFRLMSKRSLAVFQRLTFHTVGANHSPGNNRPPGILCFDFLFSVHGFLLNLIQHKPRKTI
jgi:hypothetical protein